MILWFLSTVEEEHFAFAGESRPVTRNCTR